MRGTFENIDCMVGMARYPDKHFDLCLTDPPYGLNIPYNSFDDSPQNVKQLIDRFLPEAIRVSKAVAIFSGITPMHWYPSPDWIMAITWNTTGSYGMMGFTQWQAEQPQSHVITLIETTLALSLTPITTPPPKSGSSGTYHRRPSLSTWRGDALS